MRPSSTLASCLALSLAAAGCGGATSPSGSFSHSFPDDRSDHVEAVEALLAAAPPSRDRSVIVLAATDPPRVVAYDLASQHTLWEQPAELRTIPYIAGDYVVTQESGNVVVRALDTGRVTATVADEQRGLIGAAGDGEDGALVLSTGGGVGASSVLIGLHGGSPSFRTQVPQAMGLPAVRAGMIFVPWGHQNLTVLDEGGNEIARVRVTRGVLGHAFVEGSSIFVGQTGLGLLSHDLHSAADVPWLEIADIARPGSPPLLRDAYSPPPSAASATHRVRLAFAPRAAGSAVELVDDLVVLTFYRLVFGLADHGGRAAWVTLLPRDVVGVSVRDAGILTVDDHGGARLLSRTDGRTLWHADIGAGGTYAAIAAGSFAPAGSPEGDALVLRDQLLAAAQSTDARLVPAREFAVRMLGNIAEPEVTTSLISLCEDAALPVIVHGAACDTLAARTIGGDSMIEALGRHAAYLESTTAPPVGPLARAAVTMGERRAAPLLLAQLRDPETRAEDLPAVFDAVSSLGDASASETIEDFLRLYHAEPSDSGLAPAVASGIAALAHLAGPTSREFLTSIASDALTMPEARDAATAALAALDAAASGTETTPDTTETVEFTTADDPRPRELTAAMVAEILDESRAELRACLSTTGPERRHHGQARVVLVIEPDGDVVMVSANPAETQGCIEPIVRAHTFPATQARSRQRITHVVRR
jgi:hypothetical protein